MPEEANVSEYPPEELPRHEEYADPEDTLDWDRDRDGRMADCASDDEPRTEPA